MCVKIVIETKAQKATIVNIHAEMFENVVCWPFSVCKENHFKCFFLIITTVQLKRFIHLEFDCLFLYAPNRSSDKCTLWG